MLMEETVAYVSAYHVQLSQNDWRVIVERYNSRISGDFLARSLRQIFTSATEEKHGGGNERVRTYRGNSFRNGSFPRSDLVYVETPRK